MPEVQPESKQGGKIMTVVNSKTFWTSMFDADEAEGTTIRIGNWRCAPVQASGMPVRYAIMEDGADYPDGKGFDTQQQAVNAMLEKKRG